MPIRYELRHMLRLAVRRANQHFHNFNYDDNKYNEDYHNPYNFFYIQYVQNIVDFDNDDNGHSYNVDHNELVDDNIDDFAYVNDVVVHIVNYIHQNQFNQHYHYVDILDHENHHIEYFNDNRHKHNYNNHDNYNFDDLYFDVDVVHHNHPDYHIIDDANNNKHDANHFHEHAN